jgi:hypothetical protein
LQGLTKEAPVVEYLAQLPLDGHFTLVDIGCGNGLDNAWRLMGPRFRAIGFDANGAEIERLRSVETNAAVRYEAGYASLPSNHPFLAKRGPGRGWWSHNPWNRLSVSAALEALRAVDAAADNEPETTAREVQDEAPQIVVPNYLLEHGVDSVDFLKIDIDGADLEVLWSFDEALSSLTVLGAGLEVNFFGSDDETDNTLHNTDRFMKAHGFELLNLTLRRYSMAALPSRFVSDRPLDSLIGRILQGDAIYVRDLASQEHAAFAAQLPPHRLLNLICLFALCNLADCAAEVALVHRSSIQGLCDVDRVLDLLTAQVVRWTGETLSYREAMQRFGSSDPMFFTPRSQWTPST